MPANSTPAVPRPTPRTFKLPTAIPATHTKARTPMACATGCAVCIWKSQFIGLARPPLRPDLHGIPILSQLRPKVTSHIVNRVDCGVRRRSCRRGSPRLNDRCATLLYDLVTKKRSFGCNRPSGFDFGAYAPLVGREVFDEKICKLLCRCIKGGLVGPNIAGNQYSAGTFGHSLTTSKPNTGS